MYNILTDINVIGNVTYSGELFGKLPPTNTTDGIAGTGTVEDPLKINIAEGENGLFLIEGELKVIPPSSSVMAGEGLSAQEGTGYSVTLSAKLSEEPNNKLIINSDGGLYASSDSEMIFITEKTDYDTLTSTGTYSVVGLTTSTEKYQYHAPFASTSDVILKVVQYSTNGTTYVVQTGYGSDQYGSSIKNQIKTRTGTLNAMPTSWETVNSTEYLSNIFVQTGGVLTDDISIGYGGSSVYGYKSSGIGMPASLPSQKDGTVIWFQSGYKNQVIGSYSGFSLASDTDGRLFLNVENNQPTDDKTWNWKEVLTLDSPVLISTDTNNALVKHDNGLYVAPAPVSDVVVSADDQNQLTNLIVGDNPGLFVRPVSIQLLPDDSIYRSQNNSNPKNTDIRVNLSTEQYNILKLSSTTNKGLYVAGNHAVIPKFAIASSGALFSSATVYPNGSMKIKTTISMTNPTGVTRYNNVGLYSSLQTQLQQYYLDSAGNPIPTTVSGQITNTTASTITVTITTFIHGTPALGFDVVTDSPYPVGGGVPNQANITVALLVGTTVNNAFA
ncbi:hypothetical protein FDH34_gp223 [Serratia phage BF]|uniref:Uncharacterized protein n=1 Tax=Serratia phage BF TaxID=1962671 RepID=A0A1S6UAI5_9CAUD|nr:hypothetical protein FDH34_gp223 [Serratia phage BF]AQW88748.1 hypothetical protein BF_0223 [Serratia phage BF]